MPALYGRQDARRYGSVGFRRLTSDARKCPKPKVQSPKFKTVREGADWSARGGRAPPRLAVVGLHYLHVVQVLAKALTCKSMDTKQ
jgi:hypothetical protein